jgi:hypothetical protein
MISHFIPNVVGMLFRQWLRKRMFLTKLPIIGLGFGALLLTTDLPELLKTVWSAGETAAIALEQAKHIKQP